MSERQGTFADNSQGCLTAVDLHQALHRPKGLCKDKTGCNLYREELSMPTTNKSDIPAFGKAQTERMINLQKELLETYEQASRAWLDRFRLEAELWSRLATKLTLSRSVPEAMDAYQKCVTEQMQMTMEDGKRMVDECQKIARKIAGSLASE
jgi:hypothetical protein